MPASVNPPPAIATKTNLKAIHSPQGAESFNPVAVPSPLAKRIIDATSPAKAIAHRSEVTAVYVQDDKNKLSLRQIRLGEALPDNQVEVLAGLSAGEKIILDPVSAAAAITLVGQNE